MMDNEIYSQYFKRSEFACKCGCGFDAVDATLLNVLEMVRVHFDKPVVITSGNRCEVHNAKVGGAEDSMHTKGMAVDFRVKDTIPISVYKYLETVMGEQGGLGSYKSWTHLDVRSDKARWKG